MLNGPAGLQGWPVFSLNPDLVGIPFAKNLNQPDKMINPITNKTSVFAVRTGKLHG